MEKKRAKERKEQQEAEEKPLTQEEIEQQNEEELEKALQEKKKKALNKERKQNEIQKKSEYLRTMSVMTSINVQNKVSIFIFTQNRMRRSLSIPELSLDFKK